MIHFSIIIPLYNCEATITKVISYLQNQNFPKKKFEIICVDDKSEDKTLRIVKKTQVKLIKLSKNGGNGKAKNFAIRKARGEILLFIDDHLYLDKDALLNLDSLFKKYPNISGICGYYKSSERSDMNICRDIRRRTIYEKDDREKEISLESFSPFSIGLGAIKKEILKNLKFPESFGKNSAEDTLLQINCHRQGKIFLYSPKIKGLHDHNLNYKDIFNKLFTEIKGVGDLLTYFSKTKNINLPFQYCFLSYPLFFIISLSLLFFNKIFLPLLLVFFTLEIFLSSQCFKDKKKDIFWRFKAFVYCLLGEIIKGFYLPYYLVSKHNFKFINLANIFYQFLRWEKEKLKMTIGFFCTFPQVGRTPFSLTRQRKIEYEKI